MDAVNAYIFPLVNENVVDDNDLVLSNLAGLYTFDNYANGFTVVDRTTLEMTQGETNSWQLPFHCFPSRTYDEKRATDFSTPFLGLVYTEEGDNTMNLISGTVTAAEGLYYAESYFQYSDTDTLPTEFDCVFERDYVDGDIDGLKRFQYNTKIKVIVDDPNADDIFTL